MTRLHSRVSVLRPSSTRAIVLVCGLLAGCGEKVKAVEAEIAAEANMAIGVPASADGPYTQPSSPCDVVDLRSLGSDIGRVTSRMTQTEGDGHQITGCILDLVASDGDNRFKLFVAVDGDSDARFALFEDVWGRDVTSGFVAERIDMGAKAIYAERLSADNLGLETVFGVLDANLYLEARFSGRGSKAWNTDDMRDGQIGVVGAAMNSLAR